MDRRQFLAATAAALAASGCTHKEDKASSPFHLTECNEAQRAKRRADERSTVALVHCASYDDDIFAAMKTQAANAHLPDFKGKRVVLKPNMVEIQPGHPITTNPAVLAAAVKLVDYLGAKEIIVAEGPGHMRDTEMLLARSGIGPMVKKLGLQFVDLNLDDIAAVQTPDSFTGLHEVWMPKTILSADAVVSVPKMKTHHWVGVTCSMKNLFGTVPGRKYGWPKNLLHVRGIPNWIIDLQHIVRPQMAVVDAVVAMEGDGPINGTPKNTQFVAFGKDLAAVDATCIRTMEFSLDRIPYMYMAGQVVGNTDESAIDVIGSTIDAVKQPFAKPLTMIDPSYLVNATKQSS
ncbi:MAG TPA: DUF362 domain-containing protein [Trichormus sp.]